MKNIKQEIFHKAAIWANNLLASDFSRKFDKWFGSLSQTKATEKRLVRVWKVSTS